MTDMGREQESSWDQWLADLADPRRSIRFEVVGRIQRSRRWDMGRRVLPEHMVHLVSAGGHVGTVAGRAVRTAPGAMLWVPPGVEQVLRQGDEPFSMVFLRFTVAGARMPAGEPPVRQAVPEALILGDRILEEHLARRPGREARLRALLVQLFVAWWRATTTVAGGIDAITLDRIERTVDADPARRWTPAALARIAGLSPTWFARRFRRSVGHAPRRWLMERRIQQAAVAVLADRRPIGAIAADFGYGDLFLFSRQFRAVMGVSPRAWRQRHGSA